MPTRRAGWSRSERLFVRGCGAAALFAALVLSLGSCAFPQDVEGTLDRLQDGGELRIGVSESEPYVVLDRPRPSGIEVRLLEDFARELGARVRYVRDSEEALVGQLQEGELDVVVGGITKRSPWKTEVAPTRPYATTQAQIADKTVTEEHVMLTRNGENAFLVRLERYLLDRKERIRRALSAEGAQ